MSQAQTTSPAKAAKVAFVFAAVTPDTAKAAAVATAKAVVTCEKAKRTLLASVAGAVAAIGVPLTAAQYDRQFRPYLNEAFASQVKRNAIRKETADQYASKLKTAVLAILSKSAEPAAGETFWEFYDRAAKALPSATFTVGEGDNAQTVKVWEASQKRGRKVGATQPKKTGGGAMPGAVAEANASAANNGEGGFNRSPAMAAALILTRNNERRAQLLVSILKTHAENFDRWAETQLTDEERAAIGKASAKPTEPAEAPVTLKAGEPATAMAAALVEGQRKANVKRRANG